MIQFVLKRLLYGLLVLFGVISIIFLLFNVLPGDPARMMLGQRADIASIEAINKDLGLDKSMPEQYLGFLNDLSPISIHNTHNKGSFWYLTKDKYDYVGLVNIADQKIVLKLPYLRRSYQSKRKVSEILAEAFPNTILLASVSILFAIVLGVLIGILVAVKNNKFIDKFALVFSTLGMSIPSFFAAILFAWIFAYVLKEYTGLNMVGSLYSVDDFGRGEYLDLKNLILPAIVLGIRPLAIVIELTKSSLKDVLNQDYIRTAKAKGLKYRQIILGHAMKNALNPVVTAVSGWFASLMAGAVFVEYVFDWKGVGVVLQMLVNKEILQFSLVFQVLEKLLYLQIQNVP